MHQVSVWFDKISLGIIKWHLNKFCVSNILYMYRYMYVYFYIVTLKHKKCATLSVYGRKHIEYWLSLSYKNFETF